MRSAEAIAVRALSLPANERAALVLILRDPHNDVPPLRIGPPKPAPAPSAVTSTFESPYARTIASLRHE